MLCPKCYQENPDNALFCQKCGAKLHKEESSNSISSVLLLIWAIMFLVFGLIQTAITQFVDEWYFSGWRTFYFLVCILHNASNILPAVAIKNTTYKIVAIIIVALPTIYYIIQNIQAIFTEY